MHDIFCAADLHGTRWAYDAILNYCKEQDEEYTLIYLGDAIDRGPDGYTMMKELLDNPHVIYLKGNHEDMFVKAAREIKEMFSFTHKDIEKIHVVLKSCMYYDYKFAAIQDSLANGGLVTLTDWILDGMPMDIVERVEKLPLTFSFNQYDFCHSTPYYEVFKRVSDAEYDEVEPDIYDESAVLWNRTSLNWGWMKDRTVIFGHTPTPYLKDYVHIAQNDELVRPIKFNGEKNVLATDSDLTGAKIDMDTGVVFTNRVFVLNCLTMKAQGFEFDSEVKKIECIQF